MNFERVGKVAVYSQNIPAFPHPMPTSLCFKRGNPFPASLHDQSTSEFNNKNTSSCWPGQHSTAKLNTGHIYMVYLGH